MDVSIFSRKLFEDADKFIPALSSSPPLYKSVELVMAIKLLEFTPEEGSALSFLVRHPNSIYSEGVLDGLNGDAYEVGRILLNGESREDFPTHSMVAQSYQYWREQLKVPDNPRTRYRK